MPEKEEAELEVVDPSPRMPRRSDDGREIWFARQRPYADGKLKNAPLCLDATHRIVIYGRVTWLKGQKKVRDARYVCIDCKPRPPLAPVKVPYTPAERHPEPVVRPMAPQEIGAIVNGHNRVPPWWPGPEPKEPEAGATVAEWGAFRVLHRDWVRWSRQCWQYRCQLVSLHQRIEEGTLSDAQGYEA